MSERDFSFMTENVIGTGLRGDLFHSLIDKMAKSNSKTLDELEQKDNAAFKEYQKQYQETVKQLAKYGLSEEFLDIESRLESYMDAMKQSGLSPTEFSEQRLGFRLTGDRGSIDIGVTPDQLFSMGNGTGAFVDNKTGKVTGLEAFQLTAQQLGTLANWDKISGKTGGVDKNLPMKGYIADVNDGITQLIEYILLSRDEFYNLAIDAREIGDGLRSALTPEEIQSRMNRQLKSGRVIGLSSSLKDEGYTSESAFNGELFSSNKGETRDIAKYVSQYKKLLDIDAQRQKINKEIAILMQSGRESDAKDKIEVARALKEEYKVLEKGLDEFDYQAPDDSTGNKYGMLGKRVLGEDGGRYLQQKIDEIEAHYKSVVAKDTYSLNHTGTKSKTSTSGISAQDKKLLDRYSSNLSQQMQLERDIARAEQRVQSSDGAKRKDYEKYAQSLKESLAILKSQAPIIDEQARTIDGQVVDERTIAEDKKIQLQLTKNQVVQMNKINAQAKQQKGLMQQIVEGFKASFRNLTDYSMAYEVIGYIRQTVNTLLTSTSQLNANMVSLQIASGETYESVYQMTKGFNDLGKEIGRSTQDISQAADDWLRAGYTAEDANQLIEASMNLSTLGQIDSAEATSYLISMLKGWKLEVQDVTEVVDKLTVNTTAYVS